jgi:type IV pilus assembly protein PilB
MNDRTRLGDLLVDAGVLDESQLAAALEEQKRCDRPLGMTLVRMGFIEEETLIRHLSSQLQLPMARLQGKRIAEEVLDLVPLEVADKHRCFPLFVKGEGEQKRLYVAVENPFDDELMRFLERSTGLPVQAVLVPPSEIEEAVHRHHDLLISSIQTGGAQRLPAFLAESSDESGLGGLPLGDVQTGYATLPDDDTLGRAGAALSSAVPAAGRVDADRVGSVPLRSILRALSQLLVEKGILTREELAARIQAVAADTDPE